MTEIQNSKHVFDLKDQTGLSGLGHWMLKRLILKPLLVFCKYI
jgi:hypothetical protein